MNRSKALLCVPILFLSAFFASSCSGPKGGGCTINCGGGNGFEVQVTANAVPIGVPGTISILSFTANISAISITDSSGFTFTINPANPNVDLNKLLSDSAYLGSGEPSANLLMESKITIASAQIVYCTTTAGVAGCNPGSIATASTSAPATVTDNALPTFPNGTTKLGMRLELNMNNALVFNAGGTAVTSIDFTKSLALEWEGLPQSASLTTPQLEYIEDITGVVTNVNTAASTITLQSQTAGTFTAVVSGTTTFSGCTNGISCASVGQDADMDVILNNDGTFTLQTFDPLTMASTSIDIVEGVIGYTPTLANQFQFVVTNFQQANTGSSIGANLHLGQPVTVNIAAGANFGVDIKNLTLTGGGTFTDSSSLFPGQVVAVSPTAFTAASGATPASVTVNGVVLRFSRLTGLPSTAGPNFPFFPGPQYFGIQTSAETFESTTTNTEINGGTLTPNSATAIRALYFGPPNTPIFYPAKVRQ